MQHKLHKKEKVEKELCPSPWEYLPSYILGGILIFFFGIGIIVIIIIEGVRRGHKYYITNQRIIYEYSFLSRKSSSTKYKNIRDVHLSQNIIERIFKIGKVEVNTSGGNEREIILKGIENPQQIKNKIEKNL